MVLKFKAMRIWGQIAVMQSSVFNHCVLILCCVAVLCMVGYSVASLLFATRDSILPAVTTKNVSRHWQCPLWGQKSPVVDKHWYQE